MLNAMVPTSQELITDNNRQIRVNPSHAVSYKQHPGVVGTFSGTNQEAQLTFERGKQSTNADLVPAHRGNLLLQLRQIAFPRPHEPRSRPVMCLTVF